MAAGSLGRLAGRGEAMGAGDDEAGEGVTREGGRRRHDGGEVFRRGRPEMAVKGGAAYIVVGRGKPDVSPQPLNKKRGSTSPSLRLRRREPPVPSGPGAEPQSPGIDFVEQVCDRSRA